MQVSFDDDMMMYGGLVCRCCMMMMYEGLVCRCRMKTRKRHRYSLLREVEDDDDKNKLELMPKGEKTFSDLLWFLLTC